MNVLWIILLLLGGGVISGLIARGNAQRGGLASIAVIVLAAVLLIVTPIGTSISVPWIPRFGISMVLALDGLSYAMVALTLALGVVAVVSSWTEIEEGAAFFQFNLLWTLAGVVGVFTALDLFLFFVFWEVMLVPMYFLIAIWGHEDRSYAAMKFFLFTQVSGLLMLVAIVALVYAHYSSSGVLTFAYADLLSANLDADLAFWLMLGFFVAFVVKLPCVPFHTWLPDAHTQAPTAGSVILAGILLKTGAYGLLRFVVPLFPDAALEFRWPAMALGAVSVVYGGYLAYSQTDFKRLVAYSSIAHMGFVLLGVFAWTTVAVQGAVVQMVAHGFSTAALFMMAGALQQRLRTRDMEQMGGLWMRAPRMGVVTLFFVVASLGMPGLGNFVGEFMVLVGAFSVDVPLTVVATLGIVIAAVYALSLMQRAFQGEPNPNISVMTDFGAREMSVMIALMVALVWLGVYPQSLLSLSEPVIRAMGVAA
ncbi:MAG: NADH-quinone oxidoreductase subunit M [Pseudomonadales bacterium]|nr:NADH-quinone oxidoreductase subunit M [Pseudomonadales bacterium]MDP6472691.1 NADH-quinone oxidoreductase subunit M [Pseudomonadales bacterium]MDP6827902.1 NADH-quinone oxidoreductase subunit M [Pseudomonadales bacterium]